MTWRSNLFWGFWTVLNVALGFASMRWFKLPWQLCGSFYVAGCFAAIGILKYLFKF